jgi:hypothetical protein
MHMRMKRRVVIVWCWILLAACAEGDPLPTGPHEERSVEDALGTGGHDDDPTHAERSILVDASRDGGVWWSPQSSRAGGFDPDLPHQGKALADYLRSRGYRVDELPRPFGITRERLDSYRVVIRANAFSGYAPDEVAAYEGWVEDGGRLLLLNDHMRFAAPDDVGAALGIVFGGVTRGAQRLDELAPHPIAKGVRALSYGVGSAVVGAPESAEVVGRLTSDGFADLDFDDALGPGDVPAPAVLGAMKHGRGRVVFSGDTNMWEWVPETLVDNVLEWLQGS